MKSTMFTIKTRDLIKGAVMAVLVPVLLIIQQSIAAGDLIFNWKAIGMAAIAGLVAYLLKNFFTDDVKASEKVLTEARQDAIKKSTGVN